MPERVATRPVHFTDSAVRKIDSPGQASHVIRNIQGVEPGDDFTLGKSIIIKTDQPVCLGNPLRHVAKAHIEAARSASIGIGVDNHQSFQRQ